jgi:hypothetical protein
MTPLAMHLVVVLLILVCATANHDSAAAPLPCGLQELPLNLNFEFDGSPTTRYTALVRGRAGNAIIQMAHVRLFAGEHGGSAEPWAQFVRMSVDGRGPLVYAPRIGKMAFCTVDDRIEDMKALKQRCPFRNQKVKYVPGQSMSKGRCGNDQRFHQNYNYFRGRRDALRYYLATADEMAAPEIRQWEKVMAPLQAFKPKRPNWLGRNDAVIHLRISHPDDQVIQLCKDALKRQHLCSLRLDLIPIELFKNETCQKFATTPPFEFYEKLLQERGRRQAQASGVPYNPGKPGGWDNVWIVGENKVLSSNLVRRLVSELHFKKYPGGRGSSKESAPLYDIWLVKSANYIIQTYGTFSWTSAFLSHAKEIHKPYTTHNWANAWSEEAALFVDDQPEYIYHNIEEGRYFLSAAEVLADNNSPFVATVGERGNYPPPPNKTFPSPVVQCER